MTEHYVHRHGAEGIHRHGVGEAHNHARERIAAHGHLHEEDLEALEALEATDDALAPTAGNVGATLKEDLGAPNEVVAVDEVDVTDLDFVDVGQPLGRRSAVPVVVKSPVFE